MKSYLKSLVVFLTTTLGCVTSAFAGVQGAINAVVTTLSNPVTYSTEGATGLTAYVGYEITINAGANGTSNTVNNVKFVGTTAVVPPGSTAPDTDYQAVFVESNGATCTPQGGASITCSIGQVRPGHPVTFAVFFKAPVNSSNLELDAEVVRFTGYVDYSEGANDNTSVNDRFVWTPAAEIALGTSSPTQVKSAVPKSGGQFFTNPTDEFSTAVTVPPAPEYSKAEIVENEVTSNVNCSSLKNFIKCYESNITIKLSDDTPLVFSSDSGKYLKIVLRVDAANINPGTKIDGRSILIQYDDGTLNLWTVVDCASPSTPRTDGRPCIAERKYYKNNRVAGWTPDLDGDFEWKLLNLKNGSYRVF